RSALSRRPDHHHGHSRSRRRPPRPPRHPHEGRQSPIRHAGRKGCDSRMMLLRWPLALPLLLYQSFVLALSQIWANKIRGILTTLGILIGVAAISAVIALISGMRDRVVSEFEAFGANKLFIHPQWRKSDVGRGAWFKVTFKNNIFDDMLERCPSISSFTRDAGYGSLPVSANSEHPDNDPEFNGVDPQWHSIERRGVAFGRGMTTLDSQLRRRVALINAKLRDQLKLDRDPTGEIIDIFFFGRFYI